MQRFFDDMIDQPRPLMILARLRLVYHAILLALVLGAAGLTGPAAAQPAPPQTPLLVYAAASLKNAMDMIARDWTQEGHAPAAMNYAASSTLAQQIAADAPADLFFSADLDWMEWLEKRGKIRPNQHKLLLGNELVLIASPQNPIRLSLEKGLNLHQALGGGRLAMADPRQVPAGKYGKAALEALGLWDQVAKDIAPAEHVRAVLNFVVRGETPLGIVYRSDLRAEPAVCLVATFPDTSHAPIRYPVAVVAHTRHPEAEAFLAYLASPAARTRFEAAGFVHLSDQGAKP